MIRFFLHIFDLLQHRRRLCLWLLAALTGLLVLMVSTLRYNENIFDFLPMSANDQKALTLYQDISGGQRVIALFGMKEGGESRTAQMTDAVDTFTHLIEEGRGNGMVREVTSQVDFEQYIGLTDFVYQNIPLLLNEGDYQRMEQLLATPGYADGQLADDVQMIMMPATGLFSTSISADPLALFSPVLDRLQARQQELPVEVDNGYIFNAGRRYALAMLTSPFGAMESADNSRLVAYLDSVAQATMQRHPDIEVSLTGAPVITVGNATQIKADSQWSITLSITLILVMLVFAFRRVKNLMLIGVANLFGWLFAMGFIAVMRSDVSLIVLGIGSIIIGIAANYPLHFIAHTDHSSNLREVLKEMIAPLLIGNVTTVGAFASLIPLEAPALRDLGLFAAFMLVGTILFVLVFLPHLVSQRAASQTERLLFGRLSALSPEGHRWLLWIILPLTAVLGYFSLDTSFDADMSNINYMTPRQQQLLADLNVSAGINDTTNIYLVTEGDTWDEALASRAALTPLLDSLQRASAFQSCTDVTAFITSASEQQQRIDRWNTFWAAHRDEALTLLGHSAATFGFTADAFAPFEQLLTRVFEPQPLQHFEPLRSLLLSDSFSSSTGRCSVVDVIDASGRDFQAIEHTLNEALSTSGYAFDFVGMNSTITRALSSDFNYIGFACGCIVFLFLWLSFGRLELSLLAFLPMAIGWLWILGIMSLLGMQFNIVNVILATFIFGQGDDYTIFITDGLINEYAYRKKLLPSYKNSIIISALIMFIGMGSLIVAKHPALHSLAEVTIVGMLTVVLMSWVVPPVIFHWLIYDRRGEVRPEPLTFDLLWRKITAKLSASTARPLDPSLRRPLTTHHLHHYLIARYTYKGVGVERETRRLLRQHDDFSALIDGYTVAPSDPPVVAVIHAGRGQFSLLLALVHPELEVHSYADDPDDSALLQACQPLPRNLHVHAPQHPDPLKLETLKLETLKPETLKPAPALIDFAQIIHGQD